MFAFAGFSVTSMVLFYTARGMLETNNYRAYWVFKFTFMTLVAGTGIVISAVLGGCNWVIWSPLHASTSPR